ncbi:VOC family protein [Sphingobium sp. Cam5-1]|uniref:VOC family protein n=1 Tax=Sphingobium sp. Cam5-1 TaxID=2789327 RepID=UPI0018AD2B10|nr:VOC family protein [Sphingobium sp. Cam5-1]QPI74913.1 VOC family protein [Sphingobium sp. Cam5-1]
MFLDPVSGQLKKVRQIAFVVPDAIEWARRHMARFGSGPFFVLAHLPHDLQTYRGKEIDLDTTGVVGQWGDVMVELVEQHCDTPSAYSELYPTGGPGLHHMTVFVDDIHAAIKDYESKGFDNILYSVVSPLGDSKPSPYAMMDTRKEFGMLTEFYEEAVVSDFYKMVRDAADGWDGSDPIRYIYGQP